MLKRLLQVFRRGFGLQNLETGNRQPISQIYATRIVSCMNYKSIKNWRSLVEN